MRKAHEIQEDIDGLRAKVANIVKAAEKESRELTASEQASVDEILGHDGKPGRIDALYETLDRTQRIENDFKTQARAKFGPKLEATLRENGHRPSGDPIAMRDAEGRKVYALNKDQKFASVLGSNSDAGIGDVLRTSVLGVKSYTPDAVRNALSTTNNPGGGYMVPEELSSRVIDYARAKSVIMQAGAMSAPMQTSELSIAKVASDPAIEVKAENAAFSGSTITFSQVKLAAYTIGCVITASRELVEDAVNFPQVIEGVIARALATKLDYYTIQGTGSAMPLGLTNMSDIDETGSIGAISWEDLAAAASEVRQNNHEPNAIVMGVEPHEDLMVAVGGDASTSTKTWLLAPPALDGKNLFATTNCPLAYAICGDFSHLLWGIRGSVLIESSAIADEAFDRHQLKWKIVFRGDLAVTDATAFHRLAGITS